jgi:hypothetical protein
MMRGKEEPYVIRVSERFEQIMIIYCGPSIGSNLSELWLIVSG